MTCDDAQALMHAYLDVELDPPTIWQYEQHVRTCSACARRLAEQTALQTIMKTNARYYQAPEHLRERVRASLGEPGSGRRARFPWRWVAVAACLVMVLGLGLIVERLAFATSRQDRLAQEVASAHIRSLQVEHKVDVLSSDQHVVKPWFNGKLDFSPPVRELKAQDFFLVGGRLDYLDDRPVAALVYRRRDHVINLFVWPDLSNADTAPQQTARQGYHLIHWSRGGMHHWVVSDLDPRELHELVQKLRE
jgi:mycothiol system anti-sigma-R factor